MVGKRSFIGGIVGHAYDSRHPKDKLANAWYTLVQLLQRKLKKSYIDGLARQTMDTK